MASAEPEGTAMPKSSLTYELYDAFQRAELERWNAIIAEDVLTNSPGKLGMKGLRPLQTWAEAFARTLAYRIDLIDEHLALDAAGNGRGFITFNLHWKHSADFMGIAPTGRKGTSVETLLLTIRNNKIVRIDVADNSLDLAIYLWGRGHPHAHNWRPDPIIAGVDRRTTPPGVDAQS